MSSQIGYLAAHASAGDLQTLASDEAEAKELKRAGLDEEVKAGMAPPVCRICYSEEHEDGMGAFIRPTPCNCAGERSAVHYTCLQRWQTIARQNRQWSAGAVCHACDSPYTVDLVEEGERIPVGILGGTGLVGRALAARLLSHPIFSLGPVLGSSATVGKSLADVWIQKEKALQDHYGAALWEAVPCPPGLREITVSSTEELMRSGVKYVVSAIAPSLGHIEDALQAAGIAVFSISPHARQVPRNPLIIPEANGDELLHAIATAAAGQRPGDPARQVAELRHLRHVRRLKALDATYGVVGVSVTTFQALSGRGDAKYDPGLVTGHFVDVKCQTRKPVRSVEEVKAVLRAFAPLRGLGLPSMPNAPIVVVDEVGRPRPKQDGNYEGGMSVCVGNVHTNDGFFDVTLSIVINNVVRGAWGAALINMELYDLHVTKEGHIKPHWDVLLKWAQAQDEPKTPSTLVAGLEESISKFGVGPWEEDAADVGSPQKSSWVKRQRQARGGPPRPFAIFTAAARVPDLPVSAPSPAVVEFTAVVTAEGGTADFKWTEGEDVGAAAAAFCGEHVAEEHRAACAPAIAAQVENELKVRKQLAGLPALELECRPPAGATARGEAESAWDRLLGPQLVAAGGKTVSVDAALAKKKNVALLFAADWCKPCRDFVPKLKAYYKLASRRGLEIVWVSASRSQANFDAYLQDMPWPAVPLAAAPAVIKKYETRGYPTLCFVDVDDVGKVITCDGVQKVMADKHGLALPYARPSSAIMSSAAEKKPLTSDDAERGAPALARTKFRLENVCCEGETRLAKRTLADVPGVADVKVNVVGRVAYVSHHTDVITSAEICDKLNGVNLGASVEAAAASGDAALDPPDYKTLGFLALLAGAFAAGLALGSERALLGVVALGCLPLFR
ncbi:aspartate-semialdehyde dehydrogenase [Aureococcus anophagefferens]|nr:aspartate-semialdehyde dehydrogenase [Aureococcus anophagefferens]